MISNPSIVHLPAFQHHRQQFYQSLTNKVRTLGIQVRTLLGEDPQKVNEEFDRALHVESETPTMNLLDALNRPDGLLLESTAEIENVAIHADATGGATAVHHHHAGSSKLDEDEDEDEEADDEERHKLLSGAQQAAAIEAGHFLGRLYCNLVLLAGFVLLLVLLSSLTLW
jgi:hypothetical protein